MTCLPQIGSMRAGQIHSPDAKIQYKRPNPHWSTSERVEDQA
jgi:hypothetical protein